MTAKQANRAYDDVRKRVMVEGRRALAKNAMTQKQQELFKTAATRSLKQTIAIDGLLLCYKM